ncbi:ThiF family adenylyltransferase [Falsibacillus albus]|uniref:ThiF family adenylyltransferase n=1 Tax=Falsibacillus albus TaxID=2478915 RepID=UPI00268A6D58|nr:ThiF family adenylyltransferase [Falsibacillus albus]
MDRYSRQIRFRPIGESGQQQLAEKHILIVGAGALGSSTAEMMVRSGIGKITIIDRDYVEESNLQRQQLFSEEDVEMKWPKAAAAEKRLKEINGWVDIDSIVGEADSMMLQNLVAGVDLIIDGTDNFETRFIINDIAFKNDIPWIYGGCVGSYGMSFVMIPGKTPCLQCLLRKVPTQNQTCETAGVIAPIVQMVAAHQAAEALKILTGNTEDISLGYRTFDLWRGQYMNIKTDTMHNEHCATCGVDASYPFLQKENQTKTTVLCGRSTVQVRPHEKKTISLQELALQAKKAGITVSGNPYLLSFELDDQRMVIFHDGRALVHGTSDEALAKKLYQSILG